MDNFCKNCKENSVNHTDARYLWGDIPVCMISYPVKSRRSILENTNETNYYIEEDDFEVPADCLFSLERLVK